MPAEMYLKALLLGVAIAAPVGPMALLCMRRTLARGWSLGFATGLGIATGDGLYALVAALGLAGVSHFVLAHDRMLHFAAGLFLVYLGLRTFFTDDAAAAGGRADDAGSAWSAYATSVLLTLTNPPTIVMFAAAFAALAPRGGLVPGTALLTVAGVFSGSALWWVLLTLAVAGARHTLSANVRRRIDRVSGFALAALGGFEVRRALVER
ncbi:MAG: LysE family transporter [Candidatus Baltobacteraceae bacterium]|jgi:threonine/homoserine/homoserine lactone efflux protein